MKRRTVTLVNDTTTPADLRGAPHITGRLSITSGEAVQFESVEPAPPKTRRAGKAQLSAERHRAAYFRAMSVRSR